MSTCVEADSRYVVFYNDNAKINSYWMNFIKEEVLQNHNTVNDYLKSFKNI